MTTQNSAFIFPGQGAQFSGMGKDFHENFATFRHTFEEADDLLKMNLSNLVMNGEEEDLLITLNSQLGIFVVSVGILKVFQELYPNIQPKVCAGHSLGEYSALVAAGKAEFRDMLEIVRQRGLLMTEACQNHQGTMAAILGLNSGEVEALVEQVGRPDALWAANFNSPGQVVISGTPKGVELGIEAAKAAGARRATPLKVHGAFHSGLMESAEKGLMPLLLKLALKESDVSMVMNVPGDYVEGVEAIRQNMIQQITRPVRWEQSIRAIASHGVETFIEIGCGKVLTGLNKRIGVPGINVSTTEDLKQFETETV